MSKQQSYDTKEHQRNARDPRYEPNSLYRLVSSPVASTSQALHLLLYNQRIIKMVKISSAACVLLAAGSANAYSVSRASLRSMGTKSMPVTTSRRTDSRDTMKMEGESEWNRIDETLDGCCTTLQLYSDQQQPLAFSLEGFMNLYREKCHLSRSIFNTYLYVYTTF